MFRLWGKIWKDNHLIRDYVYENDEADTRTHKVLAGLDEICYRFDLQTPMWLDKTVRDFQMHDKTRFTQDNFIEGVEFDYLEIHVIEED